MEVEWSKRARKDLAGIDGKLRRRVVGAVERFALEGHGDVKKLKGEEGYRLRVGDWRVRFELTAKGQLRVVLVLRVLPRGGAYKP